MTAELHGASRDALRDARKQLLDGVEAGDLLVVGGDLFAVVGLLTREIGLRRALGDPSTAPEQRQQLVGRLFRGKVGEPALRVLTQVVSVRWSAPSELVAGLEDLARTALLEQAERTDRLDAVEDELFRLSRIVEGQPDLTRVLDDPNGDLAGKLQLVRSLISDRAELVTRSLVEEFLVASRGRRVVDGLDELAAMAAERRQQSVARVRTAVDLTEQQRERLTATLARIYRRKIALHVELDPELQGGLVVQVGDEVIDGSVAGRLDALRRRLAG